MQLSVELPVFVPVFRMLLYMLIFNLCTGLLTILTACMVHSKQIHNCGKLANVENILFSYTLYIMYTCTVTHSALYTMKRYKAFNHGGKMRINFRPQKN